MYPARFLERVFDQSISFDSQTQNFRFVVFTDPQFGKRDAKEGTKTGLEWDADIESTLKMCSEISRIEDVSFMVVTGDLSEAFPNNG